MQEEQTDQPDIQPAAGDNDFPVIGIGASAGGLEAFESFFTNLPDDTGMAYVVVQHLDPDHKSMLPEILQRYTSMSVVEASNNAQVEPDVVYVNPSDRDIVLEDGRLVLTKPVEPRGLRLPIDFFFRSLAKDRQENAICIVLSGTASDGTLGVTAIKGEGGMAMAQDPATARHVGMPQNAIGTGLIDFVLPPEEMPKYLIAYVRRAVLPSDDALQENRDDPTNGIHDLFQHLRTHTGHDFTYYKLKIINRRLERRMAVRHQSNLSDYVNYLKQNSLEIEILFKELLIGVTRFFRDDEAFEQLATTVIPEVVENKNDSEPIRVWVPGCATGEEAYSIAILLSEELTKVRQHSKIQLFATDIDYEAIEFARAARYPANIAADVPPELLQRHFHKEQNYYQVNKHIRDMVIFAEQSVIKDPPFSRLDLISCRNLLIYLGSELQKHVIQLFHYALARNGYLFLGTSESLVGFDKLFHVIDKKWRIYRRRDVPTPRGAISATGLGQALLNLSNMQKAPQPMSLPEIAQQAILSRYPHPAVIINERAEILYFHGNTSDYLRTPSGQASFHLLEMVHDKLRPALREGMRKVYTQHAEISSEVIQLTVDNSLRLVRLVLQPVKNNLSEFMTLVVFEEESTADPAPHQMDFPDEQLDEKERHILQLRHELRSTREYLQTTIEELETSNEQLRSANEELQSSNEEFQITNEELETTKEELQSVNEELITVNAELNDNIQELTKLNSHQQNLMDNINAGLIFLNESLEIQLFNPIAGQLLNLMTQDIGRPIHHFAANFDYADFNSDCNQVLNTLKSLNNEIQSTDGHWFVMQISPYRTIDGDVAGLVVTFSDISEQKQMQNELRRQQQLYRTLASNLPNTVALLFDHELRYVVVEGQGLEVLGLTSTSTEGKFLKDVVQVAENLEALTNIYRATLRGESHSLEITRDDITFYLQTTPVYDADGNIIYGLVIGLNISKRRQMEIELEQSEEIYRTLVQHWPDKAIFVFDKDLRYIFAGGEALLEAGYVGEELIGNSLADVLPPKRVEMFKPYYEAALRGERREFVSDVGGRRYHNRAIPIERDDGVILAGMIISTEIYEG